MRLASGAVRMSRRVRALVYIGAWLVVFMGLGVLSEHDASLGGVLTAVYVMASFLVLAIRLGRSILVRRPTTQPVVGLPRDAAYRPPFEPGQRRWHRPGLPRWLWTGGVVIYDVPISPEELTARIGLGLRPEGFLDSLLAAGQLRGWVAGSRLQVTASLPFVGNAFNSILDGEILSVQSGARFVGVLKMRRAVVLFLLVWFTLATAMGVFITVAVLVDPGGWKPNPPPPYVGLLFPLLGVGVLSIGRAVALAQERLIVKRLDAVVGVRPGLAR